MLLTQTASGSMNKYKSKNNRNSRFYKERLDVNTWFNTGKDYVKELNKQMKKAKKKIKGDMDPMKKDYKV